MTSCIDCGSDKIEANGRCATCNHALRKAERQASRIKVVTPIRKDEWARENDVPALLDVRFWLPVCDEGHRYYTEHSAEAIEKGYSLKRTI